MHLTTHGCKTKMLMYKTVFSVNRNKTKRALLKASNFAAIISGTSR